MPRQSLFAFLLLSLCASTAPAQDWARKMFTDTTHDFGVVARGSKAQFRFKFKNVYEEPAHIAAVRSSCGCTSVDYTRSDLKTWEVGEVVATLNTNAFLGNHSATITVTFDKPYAAEVQLQVYGNIRSDVVLQPGVVELGTIDAGQPAEKKISVTRSGRADWTISDVRSANTNFEVEVVENHRTINSVGYDLIVRLKPSTPVGYINDQLFLMTNDVESPQIPVDVEGRVVADVSVSPASLSFGAVSPGQSSPPKNIVIKSKRPFKVLGIIGDDNFVCKLPEESREVQIIPIIFTAGQQPGKIVKKIKIKTDLGENAVPEITCQATILDASPTPTTASGAGGSSFFGRDRAATKASYHGER